MGDPKFSRPKYSGPSHPWQAERIKEEKDLVKKYGLKNKKELLRVQSVLRRYRRTARNLQARLRAEDPQAEKEKEEFIARLHRHGYFSEDGDLNDILALQVESVLGRRLQTLVHLKGLSYTVKQSRQMIAHGHIVLNGNKITVPGYLVKLGEDEAIQYKGSSPFSDELHPMRPKPEMERELEKAEAATAQAEGANLPSGEQVEEKTEKVEEKPQESKEEKAPPKDLEVRPKGDA